MPHRQRHSVNINVPITLQQTNVSFARMIFNWVLSYFLIVEGLMVVSLLPVHLETQKYRNDSINIVLDIDVPQGLQSPLMVITLTIERSIQ